MIKTAYLLVCLTIFFFASCKKDDVKILHPEEFSKVYGGSKFDGFAWITNSHDGGYLLVGTSYSNDGDLTGGNKGRQQAAWVIKIDDMGKLIWQKTFQWDAFYSVTPSSDGGYVVAGYNDMGSLGGRNALVVKIDAAGNILWEKSLGGSQFEIFTFITKTNDGGYIAAGYAGSNDGDVTGNHGAYDGWVVKLDANGNMVWQKPHGGSSEDRTFAVTITDDDGYIMVGVTYSNDGDISGNHGGYDAWVAKIDRNGNNVWRKTYGGSNADFFSSVVGSQNGSYLIAGTTSSFDGDVKYNHNNNGLNDMWIVKIDKSGNMLWEKTLGGTGDDRSASIVKGFNRGYVIAGATQSNDGDVSGFHGGLGDDAWIVKIDQSGNRLWQKTLGGTGQDNLISIVKGTHGGYVFGGDTQSNDGDIIGYHGEGDMWAISLKKE